MMFRKAYLYFSFPALVIHELFHVLACLFTLTPVSTIKIGLMRGSVKFITPRNLVVNTFINFAPFLNYVLALILVSVSPYFVLYLVYLVLTFKISLPSDGDFANVKNYK